MRLKTCRKILMCIATIFVLCFSTIHYAWADDGVTTSMFVSPMSQKIILVPGEVYEGSISVSNANIAKDPLNFKMSVGAFNIVKGADSKDDYGDVNIEERNNNNIMMDWISFDKDSGTAQPNETIVVNYKITVPEDAPGGAQYATILVTDEGSSSTKNNDVNIQSGLRIASVIYANVAGQTVKKGSISGNNIPSLLTTGLLEAISTVKNDGNVYTDAEYVLQVWPIFSDEEICTNEESAGQSIILPNTEKYHVETCELPAVGIFRAKQTVKIFGEESIVEKTVIVCPLWLIAIIIFVIVALIIWIVIRIKSRKKAQ